MSVTLFALLAILQVQATPEKGVAESQFSRHLATKIVAPIYAGSGDSAAAVVRIERASHDLRRKGFFRIGAFPYVLLQGVHLDVRDPDAALDSMREVPRQLKRLAKSSAVEVSQFRLSVAKEEVELVAARIQFKGETAVTFEKVRLQLGASNFEAGNGVLHLRGEKAGWITLEGSAGESEFKILGRSK